MLFVLLGPSGSGKTTQAEKLAELPHFHKIITATTRPARPSEKDGRDYYFLSDTGYDEKLKRGELLAPTQIHGARYGIPKEDLLALAQSNHRHGVVVLDDRGAKELRALGAIAIALTLPEAERHRRLERRKEKGRFQKEETDFIADDTLSSEGDVEDVFSHLKNCVEKYL